MTRERCARPDTSIKFAVVAGELVAAENQGSEGFAPSRADEFLSAARLRQTA
jgi:hypothetical protein